MLKRRDYVAALVLAVAVGAGAFLLLRPEGGSYVGNPPPVERTLPRFSLTDVDGAPVSTDELRGKAVAVTFLDVQCTLACPLVASVVGRTLPVDDAVAVAFSVDPAEDTDGAVREFLEKNGARGKLLYVNAPAAELRRLWQEFQVLSSEESGSDTMHSAPVRVYDAGGTWVSTLSPGADLTAEALANDLRTASK